MKKFLLALLLTISQTFAATESEIAQTLLSEWSHFKTFVMTLQPDGMVGGLMYEKKYGAMTLLWDTSRVFDSNEDEVIRFYMPRDEHTSFAVTYHKNSLIVPGKMVLRRFVGTEPTGWQNFTVDFKTGEFLGGQGARSPQLTAKEKAMMKRWGITHFED